ncbi:444_t:CDS:1, partial [Funneliformis geosporum]
ATYLSPELLKEIINSCDKVKNAVTVIAKKHHIATKQVYEIWHRHTTDQPNRIQQLPENFDWDKEIESIYDLYAKLPSF